MTPLGVSEWTGAHDLAIYGLKDVLSSGLNSGRPQRSCVAA